MVSPTAPFSAEDTTTTPVAMPMRTAKWPVSRNVAFGQGRDNFQPGMDRAFGLAFMRQGIAEECHDAIAQALEHVAFVTGNAHRAGILIAANDPLQHFRVQAVGKLGEPHQVAEQHGKLATLALGRARRNRDLLLCRR